MNPLSPRRPLLPYPVFANSVASASLSSPFAIMDFPNEIIREVLVWDISNCSSFYEVLQRRHDMATLSRRFFNMVPATLVLNRCDGPPPGYSNGRVRYRELSQFHAEFIPKLATLFHRVHRLHISALVLPDIQRTTSLLGPHDWSSLSSIQIGDVDICMDTPQSWSFVVDLPVPAAVEFMSMPLKGLLCDSYRHVAVLHIGSLCACDGSTAGDLLHVLASMPRLEVVQLNDVRCIVYQHMQPVRLPRVTHFMLRVFSARYAEIAGYIVLPHLDTFCIGAADDSSSIQKVYDYCPDHFTTARRFELYVHAVHNEAINVVLHKMKKLTSFVLVSESSDIANVISAVESPSIISLPFLREILLPSRFPLPALYALLGMTNRFHPNCKIYVGRFGRSELEWFTKDSLMEHRPHEYTSPTRWISFSAQQMLLRSLF
ncbi:hypothetical protein C8R43DRAFT_1117142 [Mycena crocata]|nr:hypothetical protein C8R43DRAFT_1117142 [Mycena crocata]